MTTYIGKRVGDRRIFAVEFEFELRQGISLEDIWGCVWLWAGGHCIGQTWEMEIVQFGLKALRETADDKAPRISHLLSSMPASEALDLVMWARYGDDNANFERLAGSRESLEQFEVLPRRTGPFFDGWQAILIEEGATEKFVFRKSGRETFELTWANGLFKRTVQDAFEAFAKLENK